MKRKIMLVLTTLAIIAAILGGCYFISLNNKKESAQEKMFEVIDNVKKIQKEFKAFKFKNKGIAGVVASYKGAHGEKYPHDYTYSYVYENGVVTFSNENGYYDKEVKLPIKVVTNLLNASFDRFVNTKKCDTTFNEVTYELNVKKINEALGTKYDKGTIKVEYEGIFGSYKDVIITLDDIKVVYTEDKFVITNGDNKIELTVSESGISFKINENVKGNYINKGKLFNLVIAEDAYSVVIKDNGFSVRTSASHAIYSAFEINFEYSDIEIKKNKLVQEIDIPVWRYLGDTNYKVWR